MNPPSLMQAFELIRSHPVWESLPALERMTLERRAQVLEPGGDGPGHGPLPPGDWADLLIDQGGRYVSRGLGAVVMVSDPQPKKPASQIAAGLRVPTAALEQIAQRHPEVRRAVLSQLLAEAHGTALIANSDQEHGLAKAPSGPHAHDDWRLFAWWSLALLGPFAGAAVLSGMTRMNEAQIVFIAALGSALVIWCAGLGPPLIGAIMVLATVVALGAAPAGMAFGGFGSYGLFLLAGVLVLGRLIEASGLASRAMVILLRRLPPTGSSYHLGFFGLGTLLTLLVPSGLARLQLLSPLLSGVAAPKERGQPGSAPGLAMQVMLAAFTGATALSTVFLTSNPGNLLVLSMMPQRWQDHLSWATWLQWALPFLCIFLPLYLIYALRLAGKGAPPSADEARLDRQVALLGPLQPTEWYCMAAVVLFAAGAATGNVHHIPISYITLYVLVLLICVGMLRERQLNTGVPWATVLYLLAISGLSRVFTHLEIDKVLASELSWLSALLKQDELITLLGLILLTALMRLALPAMVCLTTLCTLLIPMADHLGLNPWPVGFIVITVCEGWFMAYQSSDYQLFRNGVAGLLSQAEARFLRHHAVMQALKLVSLGLCLPVWQYMGVIR